MLQEHIHFNLNNNSLVQCQSPTLSSSETFTLAFLRGSIFTIACNNIIALIINNIITLKSHDDPTKSNFNLRIYNFTKLHGG